MNFKKWVKNIQTAGYNGTRTVLELTCYTALQFKTSTNFPFIAGGDKKTSLKNKRYFYQNK